MPEQYELTDGDLLDVFDTLACDCSEEDIAKAGAKAACKKLLKWLVSEGLFVYYMGDPKLQALLKAHEIQS